jgi:hypothetical protein
VTTRVVNLELELSAVNSPLQHLKQQAPAKDISESTELSLEGVNYNMAPAIIKVTAINISDRRVGKVSLYAAHELHLPQRPSKWTAFRGSSGTVTVGTCTSLGIGSARLVGVVAVTDSIGMHVAGAQVECDVRVIAASGTKSGQIPSQTP